MAALDRLGREINVRAGDDYQFSSSIAALSGGRLLVTWTEDAARVGEYSRELYGRIYEPDGSAGRVFVVSRAPFEQIEPDVAALADGGFVATWRTQTEPPHSGRQFDIIAQRFDAAGDRVGDQIAVNAVNGGQGNPSITILANQGFVVTWDDFGGIDPDPSGSGIKQRVFAADGTALGQETLVNVSTQGSQSASSVTTLADGGYAVTWSSVPAYSSGPQAAATVFVRLFDADGTARGDETAISQGVTLATDPAIATLADGTLAIAFTSYNPSLGTSEIYTRHLDAGGVPLGAVRQVNTVATGLQIGANIIALADGGYMIGWTDFSGSYGDANRSSSKVQVFDANDRPVGDAILANTSVVGEQAAPQLVQLDDGRIVVSWNDVSDPVDGYGDGDIRLQYFAQAPAPVAATGADGNDRLSALDTRDWVLDGFAGRDRLRGNTGDDILRGGAGDDVVTGGKGDDRIEIGRDGGFDRIDGGGGSDVVRVMEDDATIGLSALANVERIDASGRLGATILGDERNNIIDLRAIEVLNIDAIGGGAGNDTIYGSSVDDVILGGAGRDTMSGGAGQDRFVGTTAELRGDTILDLSFGDSLFISDFNGSRDHSTVTLRGDRVFFDADGAGDDLAVVISFGVPIGNFSVGIDGSGALTFSVL